MTIFADANRNYTIMATRQTPTDMANSAQHNDLPVDYTDGDLIIFDHMKELAKLYPLKPMTGLIALCTKGSANFVHTGRDVELHAGDVLLCPPNSWIDKFNASNDFECKVLSLSNNIMQVALHDRSNVWTQAIYINQLSVIHMSDVCKEEFNYYYSLIYSKIHNRNTAAHKEILQTLVKALLLEISVNIEQLLGQIAVEGKKMSQGKLMFNKFMKLVSNNDVKRRPISYYADQLAITPKYLTMLCLKYSDKTASDWIIQYTTEDIRFYLKNTSLSIKEISAKLGFANMSHFGSYVRKHLGMSPSTFRHGIKA